MELEKKARYPLGSELNFKAKSFEGDRITIQEINFLSIPYIWQIWLIFSGNDSGRLQAMQSAAILNSSRD
jgi:hypothetical protein